MGGGGKHRDKMGERIWRTEHQRGEVKSNLEKHMLLGFLVGMLVDTLELEHVNATTPQRRLALLGAQGPEMAHFRTVFHVFVNPAGNVHCK